MLVPSNYFLLGNFFTRKISIGDDGSRKVSVTRLNRFLHDWYTKQVSSDSTDIQTSVITIDPNEQVSQNLAVVRDYYGTDIDYYEYEFSSVGKFYKENNIKSNLQFEKKFLNSKSVQKLIRKGISKEVLIDSYSCYPVLPHDKSSELINQEIFEHLYPKINTEADIVVLSGEVIWCGWFTMDMVLSLLNNKALQNRLVIVDSWGFLQQLLRSEDIRENFIGNDLNDQIDVFTTSFLCGNKKPKSIGNTINIKVNNYPLFYNSEIFKTFPSGVTHKPDYFFLQGKSDRKSKVEKVFSLGIDVIEPFTIPLTTIERKTFELPLPEGSVLQKYEGEKVSMDEDIGLMPVYKKQFYKFKLPKQVKLIAKNGQFIKKGDIIAERSVLKSMLKEKIISPYEGYLNTTYLEQGILIFKIIKDKKPYLSDFEGIIQSVDKSENSSNIKILAHAFNIELQYCVGKEVMGKLVRYEDVANSAGEIILLLRSSELKNITKEFLINNNVRGIIIDSISYTSLKNFLTKNLKNSKLVTLCVINPFSLNNNSHSVDIFYFYTGNTVIVKNNTAHILINRTQSKEILLRLKSKGNQGKSNSLRKGDFVNFFNYFHQDAYARIENVSQKDLVLNVHSEIIHSSLSNIIKYSNIYYDAENK